jgi:DNA-binding beta-propeller fold protein YncE
MQTQNFTYGGVIMKVGSNSHVYRVIEGWAKWPESVQVGYTHGIVTDAEDRVYVFHTGTPSIAVFTEQGEFIRAFGTPFEGGAHGFYLHKDGDQEHLYVTDINRGLMVKMTLEGEELLTIGVPELPDVYDVERRYLPTDVAVGPNGDIYITDGYGQNWIHQYTSTGEYIRSWGGTGSEQGQFQCPHGLSVNPRSQEPELYVADRGNSRIQVFTMDGQFKRLFDNDMDMPCSFFFFGDDMYFPDLHSRYTIFDKNDTLITHLGEDQNAYKQTGWPNLPKEYYRDDRFSSPHGVCVDSKGNVYAAEWIFDGRVTKLERI